MCTVRVKEWPGYLSKGVRAHRTYRVLPYSLLSSKAGTALVFFPFHRSLTVHNPRVESVLSCAVVTNMFLILFVVQLLVRNLFRHPSLMLSGILTNAEVRTSGYDDFFALPNQNPSIEALSNTFSGTLKVVFLLLLFINHGIFDLKRLHTSTYTNTQSAGNLG